MKVVGISNDFSQKLIFINNSFVKFGVKCKTRRLTKTPINKKTNKTFDCYEYAINYGKQSSNKIQEFDAILMKSLHRNSNRLGFNFTFDGLMRSGQ